MATAPPRAAAEPSHFDMELSEWMGTCNEITQRENAWVDNPETITGFMSKSFVVFRVNAEMSQPDGSTEVQTVKKRYSEFEALHRNFAKRYDGMAIPPLPDKGSTNVASTSIDGPFMKTRMRGLTLFCQAVMKNNFLRNDKGWLDFLTPGMSCETEADFERQSEVNLGYIKWRQLQQWSSLDDPETAEADERCAQLEKEAKEIEKKMLEMATAAHKVEVATAGLSAAMKEYHVVTKKWQEVENGHQELNGYNEQPPMPPNILFRTPPSTHFPPLMVNRMFTLFEGWSRAMEQLPRVITYMKVEMFKYLAAHAREIKRLLDRRNALKKEYEKAVAAVAAKEGKTVKPEKQEEHNLEVDNLKLKVQARREDWTNFTKILLRITVPLTINERANIVRNMAGWSAAAANITGSSLSGLGLDVADVIENSDDANDLWLQKECISTMQKTMENLGLDLICRFEPSPSPFKASAQKKQAAVPRLGEGGGVPANPFTKAKPDGDAPPPAPATSSPTPPPPAATEAKAEEEKDMFSAAPAAEDADLLASTPAPAPAPAPAAAAPAATNGLGLFDADDVKVPKKTVNSAGSLGLFEVDDEPKKKPAGLFDDPSDAAV